MGALCFPKVIRAVEKEWPPVSTCLFTPHQLCLFTFSLPDPSFFYFQSLSLCLWRPSVPGWGHDVFSASYDKICFLSKVSPFLTQTWGRWSIRTGTKGQSLRAEHAGVEPHGPVGFSGCIMHSCLVSGAAIYTQASLATFSMGLLDEKL